MTRQQRIEKKGYKVTFSMQSGKPFAHKNNGLTKIWGESITDLHRKIFGY